MSSTASNSSSRRSSIRLQEKQQTEVVTSDNDEKKPLTSTPIIKMDKDLMETERMQLVGLIRDSYPILAGQDASNKDKETAWEGIFNECKLRMNHTWAQDKTSNYLRKSKWPNMKRDALIRHRKTKSGQGTTTEVDKFVLSFVLAENGHEKRANGNDATDGTIAPDQSFLSSDSANNTGEGDSATLSSPRKRVRTTTPRSLGHQFVLPHSSVLTPARSRLLNNNASSGSFSHPNSLKRRAMASSDVKEEGEEEEDEKTNGLEKELVQAKMRLCEAKARVNEEEANVNRLEMALWEEMLKKPKMSD